MAGASATDFCTALASLASRLGSIELNADEIPASVMSPDAAELRSSFYDTTIQSHLFPQEGWSGDGSAVVTAALKAVQEDEDAEHLLLQQLKRLLQSVCELQENEARSRVMVKATALSVSINVQATEATRLSVEAKPLLAAAGHSATTLLVSGTTGISKGEALSNWNKHRAKIASSWSSMHSAQIQRMVTLKRLGESEGSDTERAEWRASVKDQDSLAKALLDDMYEVYSGDGHETQRDTSKYESFPLPKALEQGDYKKFKQQYRVWRNAPATIKEYHLVLYDLDYIFDAVDGVEAMHLLPPDTAESWVETTTGFNAALVNARKAKWLALHRELMAHASETLKDWAQVIHSVGQAGKTLVEIKEGDGMRFMYALLSHHVKFTATDQHFHTSAMMQLHSLFAGDSAIANPIEAIEEARRKLRAAREVGVHPDYELSGRDLLSALGDIRQEVYNEMSRKKYFEPEVRANPAFDSGDCSTLLQMAFTDVLTVLQKRAKLLEKQSSGKRKHSEAGAEVTALSAKMLKKRYKGLEQCVKKAAASRNLSASQVDTLRDHAVQNVSVREGFKTMESRIDACALTLTNGQKLTEPEIRKSVAKLQNELRDKNRGGKGGKGGKGSNQKQRCKVRGCQNSCNTNRRTNKPYDVCKSHNAELQAGAELEHVNGSVLKWQKEEPASPTDRRVKARVVTINNTEFKGTDAPASGNGQSDSESVVSVSLRDAQGAVVTEQVCARTVSILAKAREQGCQLVEDTKSTQERLSEILT